MSLINNIKIIFTRLDVDERIQSIEDMISSINEENIDDNHIISIYAIHKGLAEDISTIGFYFTLKKLIWYILGFVVIITFWKFVSVDVIMAILYIVIELTIAILLIVILKIICKGFRKIEFITFQEKHKNTLKELLKFSKFQKYEYYIMELVDIYNKYGSFLGEGEDHSRVVGNKINQIYGFNGMVDVCDNIKDLIGIASGRELEMAWNNIGDWLG